ncbi:MAG TPA: FtsX-like permease family protein, partial [Caulobacter sp.]|nr:FtsX-like permease family protein [Caulobacter sp.]
FGGTGGGLVDTPTIVGVAPDASIFPKPVRPTVYYAANTGLQGPLAVRLSQRDASATLARMDQTWRELGHVRPSKAVYLRDEVQRFYQSTRNMGLIVAIGAGLALVIACLGLFALSAFLTEQRTREIGIRKALGARQGEVVRLLLWQFSRPVCIAIVLALPAAFLILTWWLSQFPARVVIAPWTFVAAAGGALLIAWLTVLTHAVSAARAPPVNALRHE